MYVSYSVCVLYCVPPTKKNGCLPIVWSLTTYQSINQSSQQVVTYVHAQIACLLMTQEAGISINYIDVKKQMSSYDCGLYAMLMQQFWLMDK